MSKWINVYSPRNKELLKGFLAGKWHDEISALTMFIFHMLRTMHPLSSNCAFSQGKKSSPFRNQVPSQGSMTTLRTRWTGSASSMTLEGPRLEVSHVSYPLCKIIKSSEGLFIQFCINPYSTCREQCYGLRLRNPC